MEHTALLDDLVAKLELQGCQVFIERQNDFRVESRNSGVVISGTPDIIAVHPDGRAVIYDVKTGQPSASHTAQVQLYMYLVPRAQDSRWRGTTFEGKVVYSDGREVKLLASSVNDAFISKVSAFVRKMTSPLPARLVPSTTERSWCGLTSADCPKRVESGAA